MNQRALLCALFLAGCGTPMSDLDGAANDASTNDVQPGDLVVRVIEGPAPTHLSSGTTVVATNAAGAMITAMTDASGVAHLAVGTGAPPWTVTAYHEGFSVVSVVGVVDSLAGSIRIDATARPMWGDSIAIHGSITGADASSSVQIDAMNFMTVTGAHNSYSTTFLNGGNNLPLTLTAIELDATGNAINAVQSGSVARGTSAVTLDIAFPSPRIAPTIATATIAFPTTGIFDRSSRLQWNGGVQQVPHDSNEGAWMLVGVIQPQAPTAAGIPIQTQSFGGALAPDIAPLSFQSVTATALINVNIHEFSGASTISPGPVRTLATSGTTVGTVAMTGDADGYDTFALTVFDPTGSVPAWRLYTIDGHAASGVQFPNVPAAWQVAMHNLTGGAGALAMAIKMHAGSIPPWQTAVANTSVPQYDYAAGGSISTVAPMWR